MSDRAREDATTAARELARRYDVTCADLAVVCAWSPARAYRALRYLRACSWARSTELERRTRGRQGRGEARLLWEATPALRLASTAHGDALTAPRTPYRVAAERRKDSPE